MVENKDGEVHLTFDPWSVRIVGHGPFVEKVRIVFPAIPIKLLDLSFGGMLPGAHLGSELSEPGVTLTFGGSLSAINLIEMFHGTSDHWEAMYAIMKKEYGKRFLLDGPEEG